MPAKDSSDILTLAASGALSYVVADVTHEALGHGGVCLASGGHITLLTSVFFRGQPTSRLIDAAGPTANLVAGLTLLAASKRARPGATAFFFSLAAAFNLFWCAGCFLYSGVTNDGDWTSVIRDWPPVLLWRGLLLLLGVILYAWSIRQLVIGLIQPGSPLSPRMTAVRLLIIPYFTAGLTACLAAFFDRVNTGEAVIGGFREAFLANVVLFFVVRRLQDEPLMVVPRDSRWIAAAAIALALFVPTMGSRPAFLITKRAPIPRPRLHQMLPMLGEESALVRTRRVPHHGSIYETIAPVPSRSSH